ncbi:MAG: hypothetical protein ABJB66_11340 [Gemmatimonadaceae bacterium]
MVQVIENRAAVRGRIASVSPHPTLAGYQLVAIEPSEVTDVAGYPNLFAANNRQTIAMAVQSERVNELALASGDEVTAQIRLAGPQSVFADASSLSKN